MSIKLNSFQLNNYKADSTFLAAASSKSVVDKKSQYIQFFFLFSK